MFLALTFSGLKPSPVLSKPTDSPRYAIAVHGGAGPWQGLAPEELAKVKKGLQTALQRGRDLLASGGSSLDAVERVINHLEDTPCFNAGKGAVCNALGSHQLDASIMDGTDRSAGGVAAIGIAKNPISVARLVMTETPHVLLVADGANKFARLQSAQLVDPSYFWTERTRREWEATKHSSQPVASPDHFGTVGCVALDAQGNLAAGTSTGGLMGKMVGRVGDSPLVGAGTYADNRTCAISCTGVGELFIRDAIAYDIAARIRYAGESLSTAIGSHIDDRLPKGTGGIIALNTHGEVVFKFNTRAMPRGVATSDGRFDVRIEKD